METGQDLISTKAQGWSLDGNIPPDVASRDHVPTIQENVRRPYLGSEHPHLNRPYSLGPRCRDETWERTARSPDNCVHLVDISGLYFGDLGANRCDGVTKPPEVVV